MLLRDQPWDKNLQLMLAALLAFNLWPHVQLVPVWVTVMAVICIGWKILYLTRGFQLPKRWIVQTASVLAAGGVFGTYSTILGQEAAGALLVAMSSLKLLETNRYRDAMLVVFTSYFLLMVYLLDTQSLLATAMMIVDVALITSLMSQIHRRERRAPTAFGPALRTLALTVPLWAFLFVFFPRFSTGLWSSQSSQTNTGFSDELDPGSVGKLVDSDEVAFRVNFIGPAGLSPESMYWRGAVLASGQGLKWTRGTWAPASAYRPQAGDRSIRQTVWLEQGFNRWLFALDTPVAVASSDPGVLHLARRLPGFTYEFSQPVIARTSYTVRSTVPAPLQKMGPKERAVFLQLPEDLDPRIKEVAARLRAEVKADMKSPGDFAERLAKRTLEWFNKQGFHYSKSPGLAQGQSGVAQLADFLLNRKVGFCEHYAAAFATLMRAAETPARVVVGFQGATFNTIGEYWVVRRMDAHAWTEIWSEHAGEEGRWIRVDPTEAVAPLRIQLGGDFNRLDGGSFAGLSTEEARRLLNGQLAVSLRQIQLAIDSLQMKWNAFLLAYDFNYQLQVLANLGINQAGVFFLSAVVGACILALAGFIIWLNSRRSRKTDPTVREWRRFCAMLEKAGINREFNEGPLHFAERASRALPAKAGEIRTIARRFAELRYGTGPEVEQRRLRKELKSMIRQFSLRTAS